MVHGAATLLASVDPCLPESLLSLPPLSFVKYERGNKLLPVTMAAGNRISILLFASLRTWASAVTDPPAAFLNA
jgi:hypothetical protein